MALNTLGSIYERAGMKKQALETFEQLYTENIDRHGENYHPNKVLREYIEKLSKES